VCWHVRYDMDPELLHTIVVAVLRLLLTYIEHQLLMTPPPGATYTRKTGLNL